MERTLKATAVLLMFYVLGASASATTGFLSVEEIGAPTIDTQVLPQSARPRFTVRQWVFPSMVFDCAGNITRWIFRAQETGLNNGMLPLISTWRDSRFTLPTTDFQRVSVSGSAEELTGDGPVYEYVLQEPVSVEEGDILGIGLPVNFRNMNEEQLDFEFLDLGDGNAPDSYRRTFFGMSINIAILATRFQPFGSTRDQQYVPLIAAVIGFPDGSTASTTFFPTSTTPPTQGRQTTPPQTGLPAPRESNTPSLVPPPSPSPSPPPTDPPSHPEGETDVGAIVGSLMAVLVVLCAVAAIIIVVTVLLRRNQHRLCKTTKPPPIDNPHYQVVTSGHVDQTLTDKSTSSNGSYHIYSMPAQVGVGGPRSNGTLSSNGTHYEFDDTLPRVLQSHYELEPGSPKYTDPLSPSATLPSQYEIPVSVPSTLPSSEASGEDLPSAHVYSVLEGGGIYVPTEEERKSLTDTTNSSVFDDAIYSRMSKKYCKHLHDGEFFERNETYWKPASSKTALYDQLAKKKYREMLRHQIQIIELLGAGQFGMVNKGLWQLSTGTVEVAVKTLRPNTPEEDKIKFLQEAAIMGQFLHPNVVKLHGVVTVGEPIMIVLEYMPKGDLRNYLLSRQLQPGEMVPSDLPPLLLKFCREIASGMNYLSNKAFVHRDLAARNVLVDASNTCKIGDFGMSRDLEDNNYYITHGGKIPVKWTAPEALLYRKYSTASDVWSYGVAMYEIWSLGHKPFEGYTNQQAMQLVGSGFRLPPPPGCPRPLYGLMIHCWHTEAGRRPTFSAVVKMLSHSDSHLLNWTERDKRVHPQAASLGAPLEAGESLFPELQDYYMDDKSKLMSS